VGATNERDTYVRRSSIMLKCRIASAGALVESSHLYGNGVSIVPNVCLSWVEQPVILDRPKYKTWRHVRKPEAEGKGDRPRGPQINCEDRRMLSARTGDKLRAISDVARKGRRVKDLRRLMNHPDLWMQAYLNIQGNKGALTRGTSPFAISFRVVSL
jgi:hypothetical protein